MIPQAVRKKIASWITIFVCLCICLFVLHACLHNTIFTLPAPILITLGLAPRAGPSILLAQAQNWSCVSYCLGICRTTPHHTSLYHIPSPKQSLNILNQLQPADKLSLSAGESTTQTSSFLPTINDMCQPCSTSHFSALDLITTVPYLPISPSTDFLL